MSLAGKLLGMWAIGKTVSNTTPLFMRLVLGMAAMTVFAVFSGVLIAVLMSGAVWLSYTALVTNGVDPSSAAIIIAGFLLALLSASMLMLKNYWRRVRKISKQLIYAQSPVTARVASVTNAFLDGFLEPRPL